MGPLDVRTYQSIIPLSEYLSASPHLPSGHDSKTSVQDPKRDSASKKAH